MLNGPSQSLCTVLVNASVRKCIERPGVCVARRNRPGAPPCGFGYGTIEFYEFYTLRMDCMGGGGGLICVYANECTHLLTRALRELTQHACMCTCVDVRNHVQVVARVP